MESELKVGCGEVEGARVGYMSSRGVRGVTCGKLGVEWV